MDDRYVIAELPFTDVSAENAMLALLGFIKEKKLDYNSLYIEIRSSIPAKAEFEIVFENIFMKHLEHLSESGMIEKESYNFIKDGFIKNKAAVSRIFVPEYGIMELKDAYRLEQKNTRFTICRIPENLLDD